jgi:ABC-2 type transport system permease protein
MRSTARTKPEPMSLARLYFAAFAARFQTTLQYRAAALAGFVTQCWWGALKVMIYAVFFQHAGPAHAPISLAQAITYTWLAQGLFALQPLAGDPEVSKAVRRNEVGYDRLLPVDTYTWWFVRAMAWMTARALPRVTLMFLAAGVALPFFGLRQWAWKPPADAARAALFAVSLALMILAVTAFTMLINVCVTAARTERGANLLATSFVLLFSGNLLPLSFFPDWAQAMLIAQPFAAMLDIPMRIYLGALAGERALLGLALQAFWVLALIAAGRAWMKHVMAQLDELGG